VQKDSPITHHVSDSMANSEPNTSKWINSVETALLLLLVLFLPTQAALAIRRGPNATYIAWGDIVTAMAFGAWALLILLTRTRDGARRWRTVKWPPAPIWMLMFAAAVSVLNSPSIHQAFKEAEGGLKSLLGDDRVRNAIVEMAQLVLYFLVAYTLFRNLVENRARLRLAVNFLVPLSTGVLLMGVVQYFTVPDPVKVSATFGSQNIYSGFWAMLAPMMLAVGLLTDSMATKVWAYAMVFVAAFTMLSGGALLALVVVLPLVASFVRRRAGATVLGILIAGLLISSLAGTRTYRAGIRPFVQLRDDEGDLKKQYIEWQADVNMLAERFLTGVGVGNYQLNVGSYYLHLPNKEKMPLDSNNLFLVIASSMGMTGLLAFMYLLCYHGRQARRAFQQVGDTDLRALALGCWGGLLGFAITSIHHSLLVRGTGMVFIFLLAIIGTLSNDERQKAAIAESATREEVECESS